MPESSAGPHNDGTSYTAPSAGICVAFDYGTKRIGTAVGEASLKSARPLSVIANHNGSVDWQAISEIIVQWQPTHLVVGWPLDEAGNDVALTPHVGGFIKKLEQRFTRPVHKVDERFSSIAAQEALRSMRQSGQRTRRTRRADIDAASAAIILESWFAASTLCQR